MTISDQSNGPPSIPAEALPRLTPEQRAQFATIMAARAGPRVYKSCVTERTLQRGFDTGEDNKCARMIVSSSTSTMDGRLECTTGRSQMSGPFHFDAPNPTTMSGTIDLTISSGAHTMTMKRVIRGKLVSADCGEYAGDNE